MILYYNFLVGYIDNIKYNYRFIKKKKPLYFIIFVHYSFYIFMYFYFQAQMPDPKTYKQHFENKHPKNIMPDELKDV